MENIQYTPLEARNDPHVVKENNYIIAEWCEIAVSRWKNNEVAFGTCRCASFMQ